MKKQMQKEIVEIFNKYIILDNNLYSIMDTNEQEKDLLSEIFNSQEVLYSDAPDGVINLSSKTLIVEHFKIDCSKALNHCGTLLNHETHGGKIKFDAKKFWENNHDNNGVPTEDFVKRVQDFASFDNLRENFTTSYKKHIGKLNTYNANVNKYEQIENLSPNLLTMFWIEDITPYDPLLSKQDYLEDEEIIQAYSANIANLLSELKSLPLVDNIMFFATILDKKYIIFVSQRMLKELLQNVK